MSGGVVDVNRPRIASVVATAFHRCRCQLNRQSAPARAAAASAGHLTAAPAASPRCNEVRWERRGGAMGGCGGGGSQAAELVSSRRPARRYIASEGVAAGARQPGRGSGTVEVRASCWPEWIAPRRHLWHQRRAWSATMCMRDGSPQRGDAPRERRRSWPCAAAAMRSMAGGSPRGHRMPSVDLAQVMHRAHQYHRPCVDVHGAAGSLLVVPVPVPVPVAVPVLQRCIRPKCGVASAGRWHPPPPRQCAHVMSRRWRVSRGADAVAAACIRQMGQCSEASCDSTGALMRLQRGDCSL